MAPFTLYVNGAPMIEGDVDVPAGQERKGNRVRRAARLADVDLRGPDEREGAAAYRRRRGQQLADVVAQREVDRLRRDETLSSEPPVGVFSTSWSPGPCGRLRCRSRTHASSTSFKV
jgi:hypothetical protein